MYKLFIITFLLVFFSTGKAQSIFPDGNFIIEYKNEIAGNEPTVIRLYKKDMLYKLERTEKDRTYVTIIDYGTGKYYDLFFDKKKTGNRYSKINYQVITGMWHIQFKGMTTEINSYAKLSDKNIVAGKECDVYDSGKLSIMNSQIQYSFYGGLMLKKEKPAHVIEAVSINENPVFSENEFEIPSDVNWIFDM